MRFEIKIFLIERFLERYCYQRTVRTGYKNGSEKTIFSYPGFASKNMVVYNKTCIYYSGFRYVRVSFSHSILESDCILKKASITTVQWTSFSRFVVARNTPSISRRCRSVVGGCFMSKNQRRLISVCSRIQHLFSPNNIATSILFMSQTVVLEISNNFVNRFFRYSTSLQPRCVMDRFILYVITLINSSMWKKMNAGCFHAITCISSETELVNLCIHGLECDLTTTAWKVYEAKLQDM